MRYNELIANKITAKGIPPPYLVNVTAVTSHRNFYFYFYFYFFINKGLHYVK